MPSSICPIALLLREKLVAAAGVSVSAHAPLPERLRGKELKDVWCTGGALVGCAKPDIGDRLPFGTEFVGGQRSGGTVAGISVTCFQLQQLSKRNILDKGRAQLAKSFGHMEPSRHGLG